MYQQFINRKRELEFLEKKYRSNKSEFIIISGRRRVGKSELILNFLNNLQGIYFLSSTEGDKQNIKLMQTKLSEKLKDNNFSKIMFDDWYSLLSSFVNHKNFKQLTKKKFVIAIDEFPFLIAANPSIPSIFQKIWDEILKKEKVMLILTGSAISIMENKVLSYKSPLYGRRTGQWLLKPLDFKFLKKFLSYNILDLIKTWFVVGGIPEYILKFNKNLDFWENIKENIIQKGSYLYNEAEILLRDEFKEPRNYKLILKAISLGFEKSGKICNYTYLDKSMVSKYLDVLKEINIIKEIIPVTKNKRFKGKLYRIVDPYFNFWFRYVYPNKIDLEAHRENEILIKIKQDFNNYAGKLFEIFIEELIRNKTIFEEFSFTKIGKQWGKFKGEKGKNTYEIDIVALNDNTKEILFAECKWKDNVDAEKVLEELKEKAKYVEWNNDQRKEQYAIFAKSFKKRVKGVHCFDLKDIEKALKI